MDHFYSLDLSNYKGDLKSIVKGYLFVDLKIRLKNLNLTNFEILSVFKLDFTYILDMSNNLIEKVDYIFFSLLQEIV